MLHVLIERTSLAEATTLARDVYSRLVALGRHAILDTPVDFRTNRPERRLSTADVMVTARILFSTTTTARP